MVKAEESKPNPLDKFQREIKTCTYCPKMCRFSCPVAMAEASETAHPTGKAQIVYQVMTGSLPLDQDTANVFYKCVNCLASRTFCVPGIEAFRTLNAARAYAVEKGILPAGIRQFQKSVEVHGNHFKIDMARTLKKLLSDAQINTNASSPTLLFPGCTVIARTPQAVTNAIRALAKLGISDIHINPHDIPCCGYPLMALGFKGEFANVAKRNVEMLDRYEQVIVLDPGCLRTFKKDYSLMGFGINTRIIHITEFLAGLAGRIRRNVRKNIPGRFFYHDPCNLGRHLGIYEEPRTVLSAVLQEPLEEFNWKREEAACCGGGGGYPLTHPEFAVRIAETRLSETDSGKSTGIVTACPSCERMFRKARKDIKVFQVPDLVLRALS